MRNKFTEDELRDISIRMVDKLVEEGYIPNCIDTDDDTEFNVQDLLLNELKNKFNMKQTAVEWLVKELYEKFEMKGDGILFDEFLKQAKVKEYRQITNAYESGVFDGFNKQSKDYYQETFKSEEGEIEF